MTEAYYKDARRSSSTLAQRVVDALRNLDEARRDYDAPAKMREVADISTRKARDLAASTADTVRRRPAPFLFGALGLVAIGVGAALIANPKTRAAGGKLAKSAWRMYQDRKA
jgi:hypothetical protein